ncbi:bifunctional diguanylate cyclase/phosphodiesterase [Motiliproteus sp. MSK22-1]|uniref:putative bifunctional diguanylate cyclase/phosphodiesterase n=1 Tax=Motiliproteus sp. MSK22-1 TaxID=1897630 RepID=UPI000977B15C|nr:EAL domain-containing protein [Motiliproteus sp. MSK22-1]OMH25776.1 hypothetical protein BGP75_24955 [Motiliproteus sp. MSK22-1]
MDVPGKYQRTDILLIAGLAVAYALISQLILSIFSGSGTDSVIWPCSGLALGIMLLAGRKLWPAVFFGTLLVLAISQYPVWIGLVVAMGNTLEALMGYWLLTRNRVFDLSLRRTQDYFLLFFLAGCVSASISALIGSTTLLIAGITAVESYFQNLKHWWMGDALGIFLFTPLLLVWRYKPNWLTGKRLLEALVFFALAFLFGQVIFFDWLYEYLGHINRGYWMFLLAAIAGIRFGRHGAIIIILMTTVQALGGAFQETGFFGNDIQETQLSNFWMYISVLSLVAMAQAAAIKENKVQATIDSLSGLPNRLLFQQMLKQELALASRESSRMALLFIDLDQFKEVNDTLGHHVGDALLKVAAKRIQHCTESPGGSGWVARIGGDEFTVILPDIQQSSDAEKMSKTILEVLDEPFVIDGQRIFISGSIGITIYPDDAQSSPDLLKCADQAMYVAKGRGRKCFNFFTSEIQRAAELRMRLANDLRGALSEQQLVVYYQPIVDLTLDEVVKAEALLRWEHPSLGMISPELFIPIAEETGQINEIGDWVMHQASIKAKEWTDLRGSNFQVSVNMSPLQFLGAGKDIGLVEYLEHMGIDGNLIVVEITEGVLLNDRPEVAYRLSEYLEAGIEVAIDDFGTGYSSLSYLKKFPIDYLKIDRTFTNDITTDKTTKELVVAIILMSHSLGLKVIAEGIETLAQRSFLYENGCDYGQGYLYSKPVPADEFALLLESAELEELTVMPPIRMVDL